MQRKMYGKHIVADPKICHGKLTFVGTRVMVWQVLEMLKEGTPWEEILRQWPDAFPREAIQEAVALSHRALLDHLDEYVLEFKPA